MRFLILLFVAGCSIYDPGGSVRERALDVRALGDQPFQAPLYCASACTMYLGSPGVCVRPGAVFVFHDPRRRGRKASPADKAFIAAHYPDGLAEWYLSSDEIRIMSGETLIERGWSKPC